jgi:hypothetical protein
MPGGDFVTYISKKPNLFEFWIAIYTDQCVGKELLFEQAWRCVNLNTLDPWDIPPDQYRWGDIPQPHDLAPTTTNPWGNQYYATINAKVSSINNFYNPEDAALNAWRFQQITKPDSGIGTDPAWSYDPVEDSNTPGNYFDRYFRRITVDIVDGVPITDTVELHWADEDTDPGRQEILGHIIPSRTAPLGQSIANSGTSVIGNSVQFPFGKSNYGHSAQFLSDSVARKVYWEEILKKFEVDLRQ